ncbi:MAG: ribonuclease J [Acidimicrobiia bacterium]|nr:ribonuclease J [Acidimicrobiia bacterium]
MTVSVSFLGGLGEIGRNCAAVEVEGHLCLIDVGLMFPEEDMLGVDLVFPDWSWLVKRRQDVECVILTHGHEDHMGALAYFLGDINVPVYGTSLALQIAAGRVEELGVKADWRPVDGFKWQQHGPFRFQLIPVTHSIPDARGIAFDTPEGIVIHSGDFKLDPTPIDGRPTDLAMFAALGTRGVRLLLSDSTNAESPGFTPSESSLAQPITDIIRAAPGRVVAACFSSHVHRVQQIADAGLDTGRSIALFGRSMQRNAGVARDLGILRIPEKRMVDIEDLLKLPEKEQLLITTGSQGEPFAALSLMAQGRHRFLDIDHEDTVIISATPIPGNETAVSHVVSRLLRLGAEVFHGRNAPVHVSGHAARDELLTMLNVIRPKAMVPVHGEYRHLHAHAQLARRVGIPFVEVLEDGDRITLDGRKTTVQRRAFEAGYVYLDGSGFGEVQRGVLRDRGHLADEGVVVVTVAISHETGELVHGPDLDSHGLMDDPTSVLDKAADAIRIALSDKSPSRTPDRKDLQATVRQAASRVFRAETSRKPVIIPIILEL